MKRSLIGAAVALAMYTVPAYATNTSPVCTNPNAPPGDADFSYLTEASTPAFFNRTGEFTCVVNATNPLVIPSPGLDNSFEVFCVDYTDDLNPVTNENVYLTDIASTSSYGNTKQSSEAAYWEAAWLVSNYFSSGGTEAGDSAAWQWAIWAITDPTQAGHDADGCFGGAICSSSDPLILAAEAAWADALTNTGGYTTDTFDSWAVISDAGTNCSGAPSNSPSGVCQELIYDTTPLPNVSPEPATMSLLALGLAGMAGAGFRRRKRQ